MPHLGVGVVNMIAQHTGGLPGTYPPSTTTPASGPSANAPEALALLSTDIEPWRASLLCRPNVWRWLPSIRAFVALSPQDEVLEARSYVAPLKMHDLDIRPFACKVLGH